MGERSPISTSHMTSPGSLTLEWENVPPFQHHTSHVLVLLPWNGRTFPHFNITQVMSWFSYPEMGERSPISTSHKSCPGSLTLKWENVPPFQHHTSHVLVLLP